MGVVFVGGVSIFLFLKNWVRFFALTVFRIKSNLRKFKKLSPESVRGINSVFKPRVSITPRQLPGHPGHPNV